MANYSIIVTTIKGISRSCICATKEVEAHLAGMLKVDRDASMVTKYNMVRAATSILAISTKKDNKTKGNNVVGMKLFGKLQAAGITGLKFQGGVIYNADGSVYVE